MLVRRLIEDLQKLEKETPGLYAAINSGPYDCEIGLIQVVTDTDRNVTYACIAQGPPLFTEDRT